jgi:hypothetical protein
MMKQTVILNHRKKPDPESATGTTLLYRRTLYIPVTAINTTISRFGFQDFVTLGAFIEKLTCINRHLLQFFITTGWTSNFRTGYNFHFIVIPNVLPNIR